MILLVLSVVALVAGKVMAADNANHTRSSAFTLSYLALFAVSGVLAGLFLIS